MDLWNHCVQDAKRIANWYNRFGRYDWYELHSAALFGLVQGIRWIEEGRCEDVEAHQISYVLATMHRFVREHIREDYLVKVPHQMAKRYIDKDEQYKIPIIMTTTQGTGKTKVTDDDGNMVGEKDKNPVDLRGKVHHQPLDFDDLCDHIEITAKERQVIDWMLCCYTFREMATMMDVSRQSIQRIVNSVKHKLKGEFDFLGKDSEC
jgi:hypothetical protein